MVARRRLLLSALALCGSTSLAVSVFDRVFDAAALRTLHRAGLGLVLSGWTGSVWDRHDRAAGNSLEEAVSSLLQACGDDSQYVEYWYREHYAEIDVHRDVDETLCDATGIQRCPCYGHVLYIEVEEGLRAPTMLWHEEVADGSGDLDRGGAPRQLASLTCVPALASRLLRFDGATLHSVAPPPSLSEKTSSIRQRSVLLFNSWEHAPILPNHEEPPLSDPDDFASRSSPHSCVCIPHELWNICELRTPQPMPGVDSAALVTLAPQLMGSEQRRGCSALALHAVVGAGELERALHSDSRVHSLKVFQAADTVRD